MEKTNAAIIAEIKEAISSLRRELDNIENKLTELDFTEPVETELIVEEPEVNDEPVVEDMPEIEPFDIMLDADPQIEPELQSEPLPEPQSEPQPEQALEPEPEPLLQPDPLPEPEPEPELEPQPDEPKKTIFESIMPDTMPWKRDIPGSPVQNILSAISLNDRVLFINTLFEGDPLHFQDTMRIFNQSSSLAEIEHYIVDNFPKWNMNSDVVYRFMMAVRRKINQ